MVRRATPVLLRRPIAATHPVWCRWVPLPSPPCFRAPMIGVTGLGFGPVAAAAPAWGGRGWMGQFLAGWLAGCPHPHGCAAPFL